ncbi:MAG: hypothetical protein IPK30_10120 [Cellvibrionales bacterium]|jgi:hypothetical protein|nr:hypothetical protein [Cellvibrionales bacterium]
MCGYCTEHIALHIAAHQRQHHGLSDDGRRDGSFAVFQEFDRLLVDTSCESFLDEQLVGIDEKVYVYTAYLLLARNIISQREKLMGYTPRATFWLNKAEQLTGISLRWAQAPSADYLVQRFLLLREYIECCITALPVDDVASDKSVSQFDVLAHLPALVEAVLLLEAGYGSADEQSLLFRLASGCLCCGVPEFFSVDLWLQRLAICALWRRFGIEAIEELIHRHTRPLLLWYLHERLGLSVIDRRAIVSLLIEKGKYDSPLGEYDWVVEQLQSP